MRRLWNTTSRRIGSSLVVVVLTLFGLAAPAAADDQVPFTNSGTAVVTGVTHLPGGLTQVDLSGSGTATHLGNHTASVTRIEDHQGNFGGTGAFANATGSGTFTSQRDECAGTGAATYTGTISRPNSG